MLEDRGKKKNKERKTGEVTVMPYTFALPRLTVH